MGLGFRVAALFSQSWVAFGKSSMSRVGDTDTLLESVDEESRVKKWLTGMGMRLYVSVWWSDL